MSGYDATLSDGVTTVGLKYDFVSGKGGGTSATGTHTFQNSTPTDEQFKNSEPGLGDTSPYSVRTWAAQNGSIGKWSEVEAPADLARPYLCDLDNGRPGMIAPRLRFPFNSGTVTLPATPGGSVATSNFGTPVDSATLGLGVLAQTTGGTDAGYWLFTYSASSHQYAATKRVYPGAAGAFEPPAVNNVVRQRVPWPDATRRETSGHLWMPLFNVPGGGAVDALAAYPQTPVQTGVRFWHFVTFGDLLFTFEGTDASGNAAGMTISARDPATLAVLTPATLAGTPAPELGNGNIQRSVPDILMCYTPVVFNGAVYFASDRAVYKMVWDDNAMKIVVVPIRTTFTRVSSNPETFQGSLYVASGNVLWKWTPGQTEWTPQPVDTFGVLPTDKGGGVIMALLTLSTGMVLRSASNPGFGPDATTMLLDANGVVTVLDQSLGTASATGYPGAINYFIDADSGNFSPIIGLIKDATGTTTRAVIPVWESNRDPSFLAAGSRPQVAGSHFWVGPWDPGQSYADRKQSLKLAALVADVTSACKIRVYYQTDSENLLADSLDSANGGYSGTVSSTVMAGQGTWHLGFTLSNVTAGLVNTSGSAFAGYAEQSVVAKNLSYRQSRLCVEIISDTTGTVYPRLLGLKHFFSETPAMYIVHSIRHRIMAEDPDLKSGISPAPPTDAAGVYSVFSTLLNWAKNGTFLDLLDANGDTRKVKYTKFIWNGVDMIDNVDATPTLGRRRYRKMVLQAALQEAESAA